jgi:aromatic ring-opening dioxygenase catalytic subunit (LigB family)
MAELVGIYAASHGPLIARDWHRLPGALKARLAAAYGELGRRITVARVDVIVGLAPDHWTNFFLDNLPALCIGIGEAHEGPPEPFMRDFAPNPIPGDPGLGQHILESALAGDFEPALSYRLRLDHGLCLPLSRLALASMPRIVPILINELEPPMLSYRRCLAWGRLLRDAIASYPAPTRVAILATGGLSHSIGEPTMGAIDEDFDRRCLDRFASGEEGPLGDLLEHGASRAGNGAHEIRNWAVAHGAAGSRGFELIDYIPAPEVYVGCAYAAWRTR